MTYRERIDIIANILNVAQSGAKKTQIMYQANLSFKILNRYLEETISSSLLTLKEQQLYYVTPKGQDFLRTYKRYSKLTKKAETHLAFARATKNVLEQLCPTKSKLSRVLQEKEITK